MEAVREICYPQSEDLLIKLPRKFVRKEIEVIILPIYRAEKEKSSKKERLMKIFDESKGTLPKGFKFNRDEAYES
jgi:hypothetical protein